MTLKLSEEYSNNQTVKSCKETFMHYMNGPKTGYDASTQGSAKS